MNGDGGAGDAVAAVLDVGSNSLLLLVAGLDADGRLYERARGLETTQLATGLLDGGMLDREAARRTRAAAERLVARARTAGATRIWGFATGAARAAVDGAAFVTGLALETGVPMAVLSGDQEARLAFRAVVESGVRGGGTLLVLDVGGGSVELTLGRDGGIVATTSLPLGALRLTETAAREGGWTAVRAAVRTRLAAEAVLAQAASAMLVVSGGTATALAMLDLGLDHYAPAPLHGHRLTRARVEDLVDRLLGLSDAEREALPGLDRGRGRILPAGAIVVAEVATRSGIDTLAVSEHGVRHAVLAERLVESGIRIDREHPWRSR